MPVKPRKKTQERQERVYTVLKRFNRNNGYSPSMREIRDLAEVSSTSVVKSDLEQLEARGRIERDPGVSRSVRVIEENFHYTPDSIQIPVVARVAAGDWLPIPSSDFAHYDAESFQEVTPSQLPPREKSDDLFAIEIQGDSMIDAMVNDGDIVVMKPAHEARNGEMVAVWRNDENASTLKYFYRENGHVRLQPANPTMAPIIIDDPGVLEIRGKVVLIIRKFSGPPS